MHTKLPAVWATMVLSPYISVCLLTSATAALNDEAITRTDCAFNSRNVATIN